MIVAFICFFTSCADNTFSSFNNINSDEISVSFTVAPEAAAISTRADKVEGGHVAYGGNHISDGSKADVLIYAVYWYNPETKIYELDTQYVRDIDPELEGKISLGTGQTARKVDKFPAIVNFIFKRGEKYKVAFWAQSSKTKAYDTRDLQKVEVIYSELNNEIGSGQTVDDAFTRDGEEPGDGGENNEDNGNDNKVEGGTTTPNNDEFRDVFCRSIELTMDYAGSGMLQQNVYLYRPLAQINVGTTGYDYEIVTRETENKYLYSKIRVNRAARYLDVVEDKTYFSTTRPDKPYEGAQTQEAFAVVDFGWAPLPAYVNYQEPTETYRGPEYPSYSKWDWFYEPDFILERDGTTIGKVAVGKGLNPAQNFEDIYDKEEFLSVNLKINDTDQREAFFTPEGSDPKWAPEIEGTSYSGYANLRQHRDENSETFKYLSMCYVLTPSTNDYATVLNNVKVWLATSQDAKEEDAYKIIDVENVPVQRNWRTNIVGNILTEENSFIITVDKDFAGEYNGWGDNGEWEWSGPLARGVYYDAEADEIQISSVDGLIWFQRMVNGKMVVRESNNRGGKTPQPAVGESYRYYIEDPMAEGGFKLEPYKDVGYDAPTDDETKQRILQATHQGEEWPENNNFHFTGATVKLMADIDLSDVEWIPIGMDFQVAEFINNYNEKSRNFEENYAANRGFYGTFDGNGHTISNLKTKRFGAKVDEEYYENDGGTPTTTGPRNYDAFPWLGRGLFGAIGGDACIKNVNLLNVDIYGCHCIGGIVGSAYGNAIRIENCVVDGGTITATPMYRNTASYNQNFARGVYLGGIVGYFNTVEGSIEGCEVRNVVLKGYRRVGGLIGSIDIQYAEENGIKSQGKADSSRHPKENGIIGNKIANTIILASQLHFPFGISPHNSNSGVTTQVGFGWDRPEYDLYANEFLGGDEDYFINKSIDSYCGGKGGNSVDVTFSKMTESRNEAMTSRTSEIGSAPLQLMPALSSWFTDKVMLTENHFGTPSAYRLHNLHQFTTVSPTNPSSTASQDAKKFGPYYYPMKLPVEVEFDWKEGTGNVGLYVESVTLSGEKGPNDRSVITPEGINNEDDCCIYVTARDRKNMGNIYTSSYSRPTIIKSMVLRGSPWSYTGVLVAPNENMSSLTLDNVAIYDCYRTIGMDNLNGVTSATEWPNRNSLDASKTELIVNKSNLRGYTVPGKGWKKISYDGTTFEVGSYTGHGNDEQTCKIEAVTAFTGCYFKAPYTIDLSEKGSYTITFDNKCEAAGATTKNVPIRYNTEKYQSATRIEIKTDQDGNPYVEYYNDNEDEPLLGIDYE